MNDLTAGLHAHAAERRIDLLGVAPVERFDGVPPRHHPASIFPEVRSVVVIGKRIPRGALRGVEEGTQFDLYTMFGQHWLADRMLAIATIGVAQFIEDAGWEAVPLQDLPPEVPPPGVAVRPGQPPPNVIVDMRAAAVRAGLGRFGLYGELLTPRFGPRQRMQAILTDAPLDASPLATDPVCDRCGRCAAICPLGAIDPADTRAVEICGIVMEVARVDDAKCARCRNGATPNPHHASGRPDRLAALCTRTCIDHLEEQERVENRFANPFRQRPPWRIGVLGEPELLCAAPGDRAKEA